jgi:hypothetical protein
MVDQGQAREDEQAQDEGQGEDQNGGDDQGVSQESFEETQARRTKCKKLFAKEVILLRA